MGAVALSSAELDFGLYTSLRALRSLAKSLAPVPGRKILIFLSAGFQFGLGTIPDLTAPSMRATRQMSPYIRLMFAVWSRPIPVNCPGSKPCPPPKLPS